MCVSCEVPNKIFATPKGYDEFVNLHLHTAYSLLDGMSKPENVIQKVASLKQKAVAVTEHGNVFSSVKIHKLAEEENIKHIYGMEAYITGDRFLKDKDKRYYHLTLLAKNEQGRLNLNKLASLGYLEGFYFKPRIDHKLLKQYSEGIIVLSGCMGSELQQTLAGGKIGDGDIEITETNLSKARGIIKAYRNIFGEDYYLEVQSHRDYRQQQLNRAIIDLALEFNIDYVATTDSHMVEEDEHELHNIFIQIGQNREAGETYEDTFIMNAQEVYDRLESLTQEERVKAIRQSLAIADKCTVSLPLSEPIIPHVPIPKEFKTEEDYLQHLVNKGWVKREFHRMSEDKKKLYKKRLMYEYNAISKMGFSGYFLLVYSYVNSVRRRGIARGSAGGSLIAYLLSITEIDPIPYGLYFERFIDVGALELLENGTITRRELKIPDVDSDFAPTDRDKVIDFIIKRYGETKFASIGQFGFIWDKSAIKDVGKVLDIPYAERNKMTQQLGDSTIAFARETGQLKDWFDKYPKLFEYAEKLAGIPKSYGIHPCGRIISIKDIDYYTAVASKDGVIVFQGDMDDTDALGLVKADLLGLKSLDVIYDVLDMIGQDYNYINPSKLDFKDEKVLQLFREGRTDGIFQFESVGMKEMLRQVSPDGIEDLGVCNALFRPSSMKFIEHYAKRKKGEEKFEYLHPTLAEVLKPTFGIMVYQEQLIEIGRLAGMNNPDLLRQATGKKDIKKMNKAKPELFDGLRKLDWNEDQLETLWKIMIDFASYSFNKSHAVAYAMIAFQMAKLKVHHPIEFMTALLNVNKSSRTDVAVYVNECKRMGIDILTPDINKSSGEFTIEGDKIRFGFIGIKGIGEPTVTLINDARKLREGRDFTSFEEFYNWFVETSNLRVSENIDGSINYAVDMMPTDALISLIKSGAFGSDKNELLAKYGESTYVPLVYKEKKGLPTRANFRDNNLEISEEDYQDKKKRCEIFINFKYNQYLEKDKAREKKHVDAFVEKYISSEDDYEFDTMGCYLTRSPFDQYMHILNNFYDYEDGSDRILIVGTLLEKEVKKSSRGGQYAKLQLVTPFGVLFGKAYSNQYSEYKQDLEKGNVMVILAKRSKDEFILSKLKSFESWQAHITKKQKLKEMREKGEI